MVAILSAMSGSSENHEAADEQIQVYEISLKNAGKIISNTASEKPKFCYIGPDGYLEETMSPQSAVKYLTASLECNDSDIQYERDIPDPDELTRLKDEPLELAISYEPSIGCAVTAPVEHRGVNADLTVIVPSILGSPTDREEIEQMIDRFSGETEDAFQILRNNID